MKHLALDFDGVVADSVRECLLTAHNAYSRFRGMDRVQLDPESTAAFRRMRPLIRRGEDYVFLIQAFEEGKALEEQRQFDRYVEVNEARRDDYRRLFYTERARLQETNVGSWLDLNPVYAGMESFLPGLLDPTSTFVVTTKDLASVRLIFERHGVSIPDENLFQATRNYRKPAILNEIADRQEIAKAQLHFIDDHVATVLEASRDSGATCYCAAWGYNTPEQIDALKAARVEVLSLDAFLEKFDALTG